MRRRAAGRRIVEVVGSLAVGGAERVALEVAAGLAQRGWSTSMLVAGPEDPGTPFQKSIAGEAEKRGVPVEHVPFRSLRDVGSLRRLASWLRASGAGVVHVHNRPQDWQVVALCRLLRIPVLYTVHLPYTFDNWRQRALYVAMGRAVPTVICVSQAVARQVKELERVPERNVRVIYNGIRMDLFKPAPPDERARTRAALGWTDADFGWVCAARLHEQKGHSYLLDAVAQLPAESRARFALAGEGPLEAALKDQAARLNITHRVAFLGPRRDIPALLGAADGYACSSMQEGHPLSLLEAMAVELPVVAPRLPSIEEIALDGTPVFFGAKISGWAAFHDPSALASALLSVERSPDSARSLARSARPHVARAYSLDAMLSQHEDVYTKLRGQAP
jgi:glycosyltransferase involved in cell wall biosynthesis